MTTELSTASTAPIRGRARRCATPSAMMALAIAWLLAGCETPTPVVNVQAPPCKCDCTYAATAPQIGKGCWVEGDRLICPLVRRSLDVEPAYPSDDPRCERQADGSLRCTVDPGD